MYMSNINELGDLGDRMMQGLPYGQGGAIAGAVEPGVLDTFVSPDVVQDPSKYGSLLNKANLTAKQTQANISPMTPYHGKDPWDYVKDIEQIKYKVTPDEVLTGIDYEMKKMVLKDKQVAKQNVVNNLKKDPQYYSKLRMLGVDDEDESPKNEDFRTPQEKAISEIMRQMHKDKINRRNWS